MREMMVESSPISILLNERNTALNQIEVLVDRIAELERIGNIRQDILEIQEAHIAELAAENQRLRDGINKMCKNSSDYTRLKALLGGGE